MYEYKYGENSDGEYEYKYEYSENSDGEYEYKYEYSEISDGEYEYKYESVLVLVLVLIFVLVLVLVPNLALHQLYAFNFSSVRYVTSCKQPRLSDNLPKFANLKIFHGILAWK